jgi:hypothetical protein
METPSIKTNEQQLAIESQKREAWGKMGVIIYRKELELQVQAQASLSKLENPPNSVEEIPAAEIALREVKADLAKLTEERKKITGQFDQVTQRLMAPEKSFAAPLSDFAVAIIEVKKQHEKKEAEKRQKQEAIKSIRQLVATQTANIDAEFKKLVGQKVHLCYEHALNKDMPVASIEKYISNCCASIKEEMFMPVRPFPSSPFVTPDEVAEIVDELFLIYPFKYVQLFEEEIKKRFSDYETAFHNKQQALELAKQEQLRKEQEIQQQQENQAIAAQLESSSTDLSVEPAGFKALKKCYEVDMPETFENAMKILSAFMANKQLCQPKTTVKKWFSFSADSAAKALAKVKSDDNSFSPVGITWKEVDKL